MAGAVASLVLTLAGPAPGAAPDPANTKPGARVTLDRTPAASASAPGGGGRIPPQFVGLSVEWSLIERYMNPAARPVFANLLANLDTGVLRIGGSSQDLMPYDPAAPNTLRVITADDLAAIRATLAATAAIDPDARGVGRGTPGWARSSARRSHLSGKTGRGWVRSTQSASPPARTAVRRRPAEYERADPAVADDRRAQRADALLLGTRSTCTRRRRRSATSPTASAN